MSNVYGRSAAESAYDAAKNQPPVKLPVRVLEERYWNGTLSSLNKLCQWANGFDPLDDPIITYNITDDGRWDTPLLADENDFAELRNGDYVARLSNGEFGIRRLT